MDSAKTADLVRKAREIRGSTQAQFALELHRGQSLVSKYERGLVSPPGHVIMHCVNIVSPPAPDAEEAITAEEVASMIEERLAAPDLAKIRSAIAILIENIPPPTASSKTSS